ncbi:NUDIX hydrolase [Brevibacillus sp. WF146]|uniref:NUDIX hydrolase n=1 Tax=Brevibacillus sp. WF146 TaxID=319501 RepID=UPI0007EC539E|nr:NUDIX hydrolase [Brevibacillus sp. WF146]UYZ15044.1 NUDIX hydrolase [Brevibacillus sp. WF146]
MDHVHHVPRHIVAVSAFVTNQQGHVLLVKTHRRSDTWELPGGQVEEGEPLDKAVVRECLEETNVTIQPKGITGVYYNAASHILTVVFYGEYVSGTIQIQPEEIQEAKFVALHESNIDAYITRPHFQSRTLDAMAKSSMVPYESWTVNPHELLGRVGD